MKWYNYKNEWVNLSLCFNIYIDKHKSIIFYSDNSQVDIVYINNKEKESEFEKIKLLMGIEEYTSRCC